MAEAAPRSTALWAIRRLRRAGFRALLAGGCVRDMLLGHRSSDYDVATDATPQQVHRLFPRVLLIGAKFGVAMILRNGRKVEVTTFRSDLSYADGRRPEGVRFATAREDARRRDFTINGMFYDPASGEVIDYVGGRRDLRARLVRTIGPPEERFAEDYLRMLRAARFAVRLGFRIHPATADAVRAHAGRITAISGERIFEELSRMLARRSAAEALRKLEALHLARHVLPELFKREGLWPAAVERVAGVAHRRAVVPAFGALLLEVAPRTIRRAVRRWGAANELRDALCWFSANRDGWRSAAEARLCDFKRLMARPHFGDLRRLWRLEEQRATGRQRQARRIALRANAVAGGQVAPAPLVTGEDLKALGLTEGPRLGGILRALYDAQLDEDVTSRSQAMSLARRLVRQGA